MAKDSVPLECGDEQGKMMGREVLCEILGWGKE